MPLVDPDAIVVVNAGANGFFRVAYERRRSWLGCPGPALATLSTAERYSLVDDAWASVVAGRLGAEAFCRFVRGFSDEPRPRRCGRSCWPVCGWIDRFVDGDARERFRGYVRGARRAGAGAPRMGDRRRARTS